MKCIHKFFLNDTLKSKGKLKVMRVFIVDDSSMYTMTSSRRDGLVVSVSVSQTIGRGFASRPGHTKDHHKNGTNCLPTWHAMR